MKKQIISKILVIVMLVSLFSAVPLFVSAQASGELGDNASWVLDDKYTLTISGTGDMPDYTSTNTPPWYSYRTQIQTVIIKSGITSVGDYAFYNCPYLDTVSMPEDVTVIGYYAFSNCGCLNRIVIPNGVKTIADFAFADSNGMYAIAIPASVTNIAYCAFDECDYLSDVFYSGDETAWGKIHIGAYNTYLTNASIYYNSHSGYCGDSLNWILDEDGVLSIDGQGAMKNYTSTRLPPWNDYKSSIETVDILYGATTVGNWAFRNYKNLTYVNFPYSIESIGLGAFYGCTKLESAYFDGNENEWNYVQIGDSNEPLTGIDITFGEPMSTFDPWISGNPEPTGTDDTYVSGEPTSTEPPVLDKCGDNLSWSFISATGTLTISGTGAMYSFTDANPPWYPYRDSIKKVVIKSGVTNVGAYAFSGYEYITSFSLAGTVKTIDKWAFRGCDGLKSVTIPGTVTSIGTHAFASSYGITSVTIGKGVKTIDSSAFYYDSKLKTVTIPVSVTTIVIGAFQMCNEISDVYYGGSKAQWNNISIEISNDPLINANIHYNSVSNEVIYGDVTGDGNINISDVVKLVKYIGLISSGGIINANEFPLEEFRAAADVTGDGSVNISDVVKLVKYIGIINSGGQLPEDEFPNGNFPAGNK